MNGTIVKSRTTLFIAQKPFTYSLENLFLSSVFLFKENKSEPESLRESERERDLYIYIYIYIYIFSGVVGWFLGNF